MHPSRVSFKNSRKETRFNSLMSCVWIVFTACRVFPALWNNRRKVASWSLVSVVCISDPPQRRLDRSVVADWLELGLFDRLLSILRFVLKQHFFTLCHTKNIHSSSNKSISWYIRLFSDSCFTRNCLPAHLGGGKMDCAKTMQDKSMVCI